MSELIVLVSRLPRHELAIRRLYARDATFRAICRDYDEALRALRFWQSAGTPSDAKIDQYRQLAGELESELCKFIGYAEKHGSG